MDSIGKRDELNQFEKVFDNDEKATNDYIKKMMGRITFLHFLQKKGGYVVILTICTIFLINIIKNKTIIWNASSSLCSLAC
jgi:hypothetical protein